MLKVIIWLPHCPLLQWYPVAVTERDMTDPSRPHAVQLLGRNLVIWKDPVQQEWHAFQDKVVMMPPAHHPRPRRAACLLLF